MSNLPQSSNLTKLHAFIGPKDNGIHTATQEIRKIYEGDLVVSRCVVLYPETGIHPCDIKNTVKNLRGKSNEKPILIITHSPLVINEMEPEEVTLFWKDDSGEIKNILMKATVNFEERYKVYALGELWLSYADGIQEKMLWNFKHGEE